MKDANVHFTEIINDKKVELYLCNECAQEASQNNLICPININDFFTGMIANCESETRQSNFHLVACNKCGMSFEQFQKTGKLGCEECHKVFKKKLRPILKRLHGDLQHNGKNPCEEAISKISEKVSKSAYDEKSDVIEKSVKTGKPEKTPDEIETLKNDLNKAIQSEEYEKAAELRDKIKLLKNNEISEK
jgi:protein arginine kinase activator